MPRHESEIEDNNAEQVFAAPNTARSSAAAVLANQNASPNDRASALWTLGRSAYYSNRMSDAVLYLGEALPLTNDSQRRSDILLTLSIAMSKEGRSLDALGLLDTAELDLTDGQRGQLHNQRGIILTELGRLPEAVAELRVAQLALNECGDQAAECRTLVNLGAAASMMGDQPGALKWYELGRELANSTGQNIVAAGIEGNLGYAASRSGDFGTALKWYDRARSSFSKLGDVDLLVAVLEVDYAVTLLDLGLNFDAAVAAGYAVESSQSGKNRMLEVQALVMLGEAHSRLGRIHAAETNLRRALDNAEQVGIKPWALRAGAGLLQLRALFGIELEDDFSVDVRSLAGAMLEAGWGHEALRAIQSAAQALLAEGKTIAASALLTWGTEAIDERLVDPIDREFSAALLASVNNDRPAQRKATEVGLAEIDRQRGLLGSAELQIRLGHRARGLRDLAVTTAISDNDASAALLTSEMSRGWFLEGPQAATSSTTKALLSELRSLRVGLAESKLTGSAAEHLEDRAKAVESQITESHRRNTSLDRPFQERVPLDLERIREVAADTALLTFVRSGDKFWAVHLDGKTLELVELGPVEPIELMVRAQRLGLRRLASSSEGSLKNRSDRLSQINHELDGMLVAPMDLGRHRALVIVPARSVSGLAWSGLPSLVEAPITVSPSLSMWVRGLEEVSVASVAFVGGPGLAEVDRELEDLNSIWGSRIGSQLPMASVAAARVALATHDLVHIAAHGSFRSDNPFFSSIEFADGPLTLLDLGDSPAVPELVVLASCDGAASAGGEGTEVVGTTSTILGLGVSAVVAPTVAVSDVSARLFSSDLHRSLVEGATIGEAARDARVAATSRGAPDDISAGQAFQLHGSRATLRRLNISRI